MDDDIIILNDSLYKCDKIENLKSNENICSIIKNTVGSNSNDLKNSKLHSNNIHIEDKFITENFKEKYKNTSNFSSNSPNCININSNIKCTKEKEWNDSEENFPEISFEYQNNLKNNLNMLSQNDSDYELQNIHSNHLNKYTKKLKTKYKNRNQLSIDNITELLGENHKNEKKDKIIINKSKKVYDEKNKQEKLKQNKTKEQEKVINELKSKNFLNFNPDYNIKSMEIIIDEEFKNFDFFPFFLKYAEENDVKYNIKSQLIHNCISWNRNVKKNYINNKNEICSSLQVVNENHIIIVWNCEETVNHIFNNTFIPAISNIKLLMPDTKLSLVLYKIKSYFKYLKNMKDQIMQEEILKKINNKKQKNNKTALNNNFLNYPKISKTKFEEYLVEIQLMFNISSKLIETQNEMLLWIYQYTKSLALLPLKIQKNLQSSKINWYVNSDHRDTVKVDKDGNGLKRLWQQHLCQFTLMSLEISEAISLVYKSPLQLIKAYKSCNQNEGEMLLKDIPIRRAVGPQATVRKIGPELSKKIFIMFTSDNGNVYLND